MRSRIHCSLQTVIMMIYFTQQVPLVAIIYREESVAILSLEKECVLDNLLIPSTKDGKMHTHTPVYTI